jgi:hypothetical protein
MLPRNEIERFQYRDRLEGMRQFGGQTPIEADDKANAVMKTAKSKHEIERYKYADRLEGKRAQKSQESTAAEDLANAIAQAEAIGFHIGFERGMQKVRERLIHFIHIRQRLSKIAPTPAEELHSRTLDELYALADELEVQLPTSSLLPRFPQVSSLVPPMKRTTATDAASLSHLLANSVSP